MNIKENIYLSSPMEHTIAVATTEADEAIASSSDILKIMGISPTKGANQDDSGHFWSLRLVWC